MNGFDMIAFVTLVSVIGAVLLAIIVARSRRHALEGAVGNDGETARLHDEVRQLKERMQVIERITVEKENSLERQIEDLRRQPIS